MTSATRCSMPTALFSGNGIWSLQLARQIASAASLRRKFQSYGVNGANMVVSQPHIRQPTRLCILDVIRISAFGFQILNYVHRHVHRTTIRLLPRHEPGREADASEWLAAKADESER